MKMILKSLLMAALFVGLGSTAFAQKTATAPATASILTNLTIALDATQNAIAFGKLSATTSAPVVLDANGLANSNTGSVTNVARFDLAGANNAVTVNYDATTVLTGPEATPGTPSTAAKMTMTAEVVGAALKTPAAQEAATAVSIGSSVTPALNVYYLWVGGSIPALTGQATGTYAGLFNINVEYN